LLDRYINLLKSGKIVAFPTETVYGLGADAWNETAVQKVFDAKERPADNPLIVHISSRAIRDDFAADIPDEAKKLMTAFWPGPLTLIFKKKPKVPDIVTAGLNTVALRWPSHPLSQDLIARAGPLVAPSANISGKPSPTRPAHVREDFGEHFPIVEAGETQLGLESTVLDVSEEPFRLYRPGGISRKQIEEVLGRSIESAEIRSKSETAEESAEARPENEPPASHPDKSAAQHAGETAEKSSANGETSDSPEGTPATRPGDGSAKSPGTKYSHYAPDAQVQWLTDFETDTDTDAIADSNINKNIKANINKNTPNPNIGSESILYLLHSRKPEKEAENVIYFANDYGEMAHQLYDRFRQADRQGYTRICVEPFSDALLEQQILAEALQNRISKAIG
jgi:L-threonylcarbamoyladenylate synthase